MTAVSAASRIVRLASNLMPVRGMGEHIDIGFDRAYRLAAENAPSDIAGDSAFSQ